LTDGHARILAARPIFAGPPQHVFNLLPRDAVLEM
jgi:hypothetical protein